MSRTTVARRSPKHYIYIYVFYMAFNKCNWIRFSRRRHCRLHRRRVTLAAGLSETTLVNYTCKKNVPLKAYYSSSARLPFAENLRLAGGSGCRHALECLLREHFKSHRYINYTLQTFVYYDRYRTCCIAA